MLHLKLLKRFKKKKEWTSLEEVDRVLEDNPHDLSSSDEEERSIEIDYDSTSDESSSSTNSSSKADILETFATDVNVSNDDTISQSTIGLNLEFDLEIEPEDMCADVLSVPLP